MLMHSVLRNLNEDQLKLMKKIADQSTPEDFQKLLDSGFKQFPQGSLTPEEMESLQPGDSCWCSDSSLSSCGCAAA